MSLVKSNIRIEDKLINFGVPFAKVDVEKRLVRGFATLDNVDEQGDRVTKTGSREAFELFRGNIREMHQPIAAGKLVSVEEQKYVSEDGQLYDGFYVTAYISKGAEDTWQKVLDGTLSGFSIGGNIIESDNEFDSTLNKVIRVIKRYALFELSLVDNPCNQLANIFSIEKNSEGAIAKGISVETSISNILWCEEHKIARAVDDMNDTACLICENDMLDIGWIEKSGDFSTAIGEVVNKFLSQKEETEIGEGGVKKMSEEVEEVVEEEVSEEVVVDELTTEPDFEKMFGEFKDAIKSSVELSHETVQKAIQQVEEQVDSVTKTFDTKVAGLEERVESMTKRLEELKHGNEQVAKRLESLESATAIKKSGEVTTEPVTKAKDSLWAGAFFQ